jgi:hypothetical protein
MIAKNELHEWERMVPYSCDSLCRYDSVGTTIVPIRSDSFVRFVSIF